MPGTSFELEVTPRIPPRLERLRELANNLWYSWDRPTRALFARLHPGLWRAVGHSPKAFLKRVHQRRLEAAAEDPVFLNAYDRVLAAYDAYHREPATARDGPATDCGLVAYFCAEFGFHESLPIYSGGLGILAGDHCKAASDVHLAFIGVGLLYDQGYFLQTIDGEGAQHAVYVDSDFDDLPISPVLHEDGSELRVRVALPGREVALKVWRARIGRVVLYLLDSVVEQNSAADRAITHRLYGGDRTTRIEQELLLGVGGVRMLAALGVEPTVWHINEGHAAFLVLERLRATMLRGLGFDAALEAVAASTVFTTHTAVPAGHDRFGKDVMRRHLERWAVELGVPLERLLELGHNPDGPEFDMTSLALRGSRHHNGVSAINGRVAARICAHHWPQIEPCDNPVDHITNGVHAPTFLAPEWYDLFDRHLGYGWMQRLTDESCWRGVHDIPAQQFWAVRQALKAHLFHLVCHRVSEQHARNQGSEAHLDRLLKLVDPHKPKALTIGFARRFATYKRATLLFEDLDWLAELLGDARRPVIVLFAGKAHPADAPGQELIRRVAEVARMPQFEGRILLLEGYDLRLARRLVAGVDVWLNNPIYPLEASGTSGMKAAMNGVINLSVLDGWWAEGYDGTNGWAIKPVSDRCDEQRRNREEARTLYEILQDAVIPTFFDVGPLGFSEAWVAMAKRSIATLLPRFNTERMLGEYIDRFYRPAAAQGRRFARDDFAAARELAAWKAKVRASWSRVRLRRLDGAPRRIAFGERVRFELAVALDALAPDDVKVELLFGRPARNGQPSAARAFELKPGDVLDGGARHYALELEPDLCGKTEYRFRAYPRHALLTHPFEMGMMMWL
jgi:starch phosphorylase